MEFEAVCPSALNATKVVSSFDDTLDHLTHRIDISVPGVVDVIQDESMTGDWHNRKFNISVLFIGQSFLVLE